MKLLLGYIFLSTTVLVSGDYGHHHKGPSYIFKPAGVSKQYTWTGPLRKIPLNIPRPVYVKKWIPFIDPTYKVSYVSNIPSTVQVSSSSNNHNFLNTKGFGRAKGFGNHNGFGHPKPSSIAHASASSSNQQYVPPSHPNTNAIYPHKPPIPTFNTNNIEPQPVPKVKSNQNIHPPQPNTHGNHGDNPLVHVPDGPPLPLASHEQQGNIQLSDIRSNSLTGGEGESSYSRI